MAFQYGMLQVTRISIFPGLTSFRKEQFVLGVAKGTSKILGLVNVSSDLEISTAFAKSLEVSFVEYLFRSRILTCFVSVSDFQTRVSASRRVSDFTIRHPSFWLP